MNEEQTPAECLMMNQRVGLTKPLPAFSRERVMHAAPLDVNELIAGMAGMLGTLIGEHIEVTLALAPDLSLALADRSQLEQVVINLAINARDAMPYGGSVMIETADVELESSLFHLEAILPGHYVMLAITDEGGGMSKATQRRLVDRLFAGTETPPAAGPGLSATYDIVRQCSGYIWVYSELGLGTTFKVYLPQSDRRIPAQTSGAEITTPVNKQPSETVLVVEDEAGVRQISMRVLESAGYRVLAAQNGDDAETSFVLHDGPIDLVVTDVHMPRCGGPELVRRLRLHAPPLKVLYMSGYPEQSVVQNTGIERSAFVRKPFTAAEFVRQVRHALDR